VKLERPREQETDTSRAEIEAKVVGMKLQTPQKEKTETSVAEIKSS
jgi:hypothetical protein